MNTDARRSRVESRRTKAPSPHPSPIRWERVAEGRVRVCFWAWLRPSRVGFIRVQVVKPRINKGFLEAMDGHCQWNCQQSSGPKHNSPLPARTPLELAHDTPTCLDGTVA